MQYRRLGKTDLNVSILSYGASPLGGFYGDVDEKKQIDSIHYAIKNGINFIDTSPYYGNTKSEEILGKALVDIPRDKFIIGTKVGRYGRDDFNFSKERIKESVKESLDRLQLDHLDILQLHDIEFGNINQIIKESIPTLMKLKSDGLVRHIGVTGLPLAAIERVVDTVPDELDVILSYCHYSLNDSSLDNLVPKLKGHNIGIINASALSMGLLTETGPRDWHPASNEIKLKCKEAAEFCRQRGSNISKLALQYTLGHPDLATHLVGMPCIENVKDNLKTLQDPIDKELLNDLIEFMKPIHNMTWPSGREENN
ncbi:hypothetical protein CYY_004132 [Polysphondylium violaceum]|uniref:NADP-dependent oxidoreductase domain-containing protein n=1 Tax=Polysphondylium violaceum TaxID=133409 RepID=A0A8J4V815_9MYCE|nr:hypothetical protein CYY_004132 [Polysphondylium violaceum]